MIKRDVIVIGAGAAGLFTYNPEFLISAEAGVSYLA